MAKYLAKKLEKHLQIKAEINGQIELAVVVVGALKAFQSWPLNRSPAIDKLAFVVFFVICNIVIIGMWTHIIKLYLSGDFQYNALAQNFSVITLATAGYQYCICIFRYRYLAKDLLDEMGDFRKYEKPPGIEFADAILNALFKALIYEVIILTPILLYILLPASCEEDDYTCGLLYPAYIPRMMQGVKRRILLILQVISAWSYVLFGTASLWIGMHMAEYLVWYLKYCQTLTKQIKFIEDFGKRRRQLRYVIKYHHRIIYLYEKFHTIVKGLYVVHAISTPVEVAMFIYSFKLDFHIQSFVIFVCLVGTLLFICYEGQRIIDESENLADSIYDAIPLDGDIITAKMLLIMLVRCKRPLKVPAGSLTSCDFQLFSASLSASYSYLALLLNTNAE